MEVAAARDWGLDGQALQNIKIWFCLSKDFYHFDDEVVVEHLVGGCVHGGDGTGHGTSENRWNLRDIF